MPQMPPPRLRASLETSSERKQTHLHSFMQVYFQKIYNINQCNKRNYKSVRIKHQNKEIIFDCSLRSSCSQ